MSFRGAITQRAERPLYEMGDGSAEEVSRCLCVVLLTAVSVATFSRVYEREELELETRQEENQVLDWARAGASCLSYSRD